jgi:hypothetical protein
MSLVIAFAGPAAHGKTTCAILAEEYLRSRGFKVKIISFADRLKEACKIIFRLTDKDLNNHISKATLKSHLGSTPRAVMQKFGTEICRDGIKEHLHTITSSNETIWTWNVEQDIREQKQENSIAIIPDLRFKDEHAMLKRFNAIVINVVRPGYKLIETSSHLSEQGLEADFTIVNDVMDDNYTSLGEKIHSLLNRLIEPV